MHMDIQRWPDRCGAFLDRSRNACGARTGRLFRRQLRRSASRYVCDFRVESVNMTDGFRCDRVQVFRHGEGPRTMAQSDTRSPTVFVIDDDADVRASIAGLLKLVGLRTETFESAREFLSRERSDGPGCLVLDFALPKMSGVDAQRELFDAGVQIPIIFISGYDDTPTSERAMNSGAVAFLTKPFGDQDLLDAIQEALNRDRTMRQG
jgi:CheY-like chemotaxis protein